PNASVRQHTSSGMPNGIKFAGEDSKDKMYEPKHSKKLVRVLTVVAYIFSVSLAAIMLSVYYVFLWNPKDVPHRAIPRPTPSCLHAPNASFATQEKPTVCGVEECSAITLSKLDGGVSVFSLYSLIPTTSEQDQ
ncbi:hypothetical protein L9F63_027108, partial [Diploptera punctata]